MEKILQGCEIFPLNISCPLTHLIRLHIHAQRIFLPFIIIQCTLRLFNIQVFFLIQYKMSLIPQQINKQRCCWMHSFTDVGINHEFYSSCQARFAILK